MKAGGSYLVISVCGQCKVINKKPWQAWSGTWASKYSVTVTPVGLSGPLGYFWKTTSSTAWFYWVSKISLRYLFVFSVCLFCYSRKYFTLETQHFYIKVLLHFQWHFWPGRHWNAWSIPTFGTSTNCKQAVWSITEFYSVDFSQAEISVKKYVMFFTGTQSRYL